ncbi:M20/M25/M40 family metallo-hydrolase [Desulfatiferula olefinivorans]
MDGAGNLWVSVGEGPWSETLVLDAHMDVVQEGCAKSLDHRDGCLYGLGVTDNLTAVTFLAMLAVTLIRQRVAVERPVRILFSTGEEGEGDLCGVRQVVADHPSAPYAFISFDLCFDEYSVAGLGSLRYALEVQCPGGHSWSDYGLPGAIDRMMAILDTLKQETVRRAAGRREYLSFNIGTVTGGEGINSIARSALARFEFRSVDPDPLTALDRLVHRQISLVNQDHRVKARCTPIGQRPAARPVLPERTEPLVRRILESVGRSTRSVVRSTNINATLAAGWPSICLGLCEGGRFHSREEYLRIDSLETGWQVLLRLTQAIAGGAPLSQGVHCAASEK